MNTLENIDRQNILNNPFALQKIQEEMKTISHFIFEGRVCFLKKDIVEFYDVSEDTIERILEKMNKNYEKMGMRFLRGNGLSKRKMILVPA